MIDLISPISISTWQFSFVLLLLRSHTQQPTCPSFFSDYYALKQLTCPPTSTIPYILINNQLILPILCIVRSHNTKHPTCPPSQNHKVNNPLIPLFLRSHTQQLAYYSVPLPPLLKSHNQILTTTDQFSFLMYQAAWLFLLLRCLHPVSSLTNSVTLVLPSPHQPGVLLSRKSSGCAQILPPLRFPLSRNCVG